MVTAPDESTPAERFKKKGGLTDTTSYGGEKEGYTLQSAMELQGMKGQALEVDIKRGQNHDMASQESPAYKALSRTALDGSDWRSKLSLEVSASTLPGTTSTTVMGT